MATLMCICGHRPEPGAWLADHVVIRRHFPICSCGKFYRDRADLLAHQHALDHVGSPSTEAAVLICACGKCFSPNSMSKLLQHCAQDKHPFYVQYPSPAPVHTHVDTIGPAVMKSFFSCGHCKKVFRDAEALQQHLIAMKVCNRCFITCRSSQDLQQHRCGEDSANSCRNCGRIEMTGISQPPCQRDSTRKALQHYQRGAFPQRHPHEQLGPPPNWTPCRTIAGELYHRPPTFLSSAVADGETRKLLTESASQSANQSVTEHHDQVVRPRLISGAKTDKEELQPLSDRNPRKRNVVSLDRDASLSPYSKRARMCPVGADPAVANRDATADSLLDAHSGRSAWLTDSGINNTAHTLSREVDGDKDVAPLDLNDLFDSAEKRALQMLEETRNETSLVLFEGAKGKENTDRNLALRDNRKASPPTIKCVPAAMGSAPSWMKTWSDKPGGFASLTRATDQIVPPNSASLVDIRETRGKPVEPRLEDHDFVVDDRDTRSEPILAVSRVPVVRHAYREYEDGEIL